MKNSFGAFAPQRGAATFEWPIPASPCSSVSTSTAPCRQSVLPGFSRHPLLATVFRRWKGAVLLSHELASARLLDRRTRPRAPFPWPHPLKGSGQDSAMLFCYTPARFALRMSGYIGGSEPPTEITGIHIADGVRFSLESISSVKEHCR